MSRTLMKKLNTTAYAILSWLAVRSWTTYELAKQLRRNLRFFWPRAESRLYEEPKNLVAHGLATAHYSYVGKRRRTTYRITPAGREALRRWLDEPNADLQLHFEALLKVFFLGEGTPEQLLANIDSARMIAEEIQRQGAIVATEYLGETSAHPERAHISGLVFDFLWGFADHLLQWAEESRAEVETWDDVTPTGKSERAFRVFRAALESKD